MPDIALMMWWKAGCAKRAALAEAGDRAVHEVGLHRRQRRVVAAELGDDARQEVLDHDVGGPGQVQHDLAASGCARSSARLELAGVDPHEVRGLVGAPRLELDVAPPGVVPLARALDLDHARAEIGEQPRAVGSGQHAREIEHADLSRSASSGPGMSGLQVGFVWCVVRLGSAHSVHWSSRALARSHGGTPCSRS